MIDWEMKARQLAENLQTVAAVVTATGIVVMFAGARALALVGLWMVGVGCAAMAGARITS